MEFVPAHQAYLHTGRMGYRTFLKVNGAFYEAFADTDRQQTMCIDQNVLRIEEKAQDKGIVTRVTYYTLPEEKLGALVRKVELQNITNQPVEVEYLDGAPAIKTEHSPSPKTSCFNISGSFISSLASRIFNELIF